MKKHIPNSITCCNLICGCIAITFAITGNLGMALLFIVLGAVFDFFDGMTARLLGVSSPIGKELDSLADVVTFGVAPSMMVFYELQVMDYPSFLNPISSVLPYFAFLMAAFSGLRLAKFNLDERQAMGFIGLPTPANALFWGSLLAGGSKWLEASPWISVAILVMVCVSSWLLVAEIPMFALKFKHWTWKDNEVKWLFLICCIILLAIFRLPGLAFCIIWYVILSAITNRK